MQLVVVVRDATRPNNYTDMALGPDLQIRLNPHLYASMVRTGRCRQGANFKKTLIGASHYYYTSMLAHSRRSAMLSHVPHHQAILRAHDADLAELVGRTNVHIFLVPR